MTGSGSPRSDASGDSDNDSQHAGQHAKGAAVKDKECPYCHQKFTSSSLGRHLDQFIHKKKPDGLHDVDEIRKLRGTITRRTARNSKKHDNLNNAGATDTSARPSPAPGHPPQPPPYIEVPVDRLNTHQGGVHASINRMTWHSTGIIDPTTINPSPSSTHTPINLAAPAISASPSKKRSFTTYASDQASASNATSPAALADTARALELSLREVLDTLRAATKHVETPPSPFDFDLAAQTYPSLILKLLPAPPTLNQASPFSTLQSLPFAIPGPDQLTPLRNRLTYTIDRWKWNALRLAQRTTTNIADEASFLSSQADNYTNSALQHLNLCFENWMIHPADTRDALWHIELVRAFQSQKDKAAEAEERMESLSQEVSQLKQQVEYLSQCQWPREMALWPPDRLTYGKKMRDEVRLINLQRPPYTNAKPPPGAAPTIATLSRARSEGTPLDDPAPQYQHSATDQTDDDDEGSNMVVDTLNSRGDKWDFDQLVNKWRTHVKDDRLRRTPWLHYQQTGTGHRGSGMAESPQLDAARGLNGGPNGTASSGSPNTTMSGAEANNRQGLGIDGTVPPRKDKPAFGKGNHVRIISDW